MTRTMRILAAAALAAGALPSAGCMSGGQAGDGDGGGYSSGGPSLQDKYHSCVDPCWPERYSYQARQEMLSPFANHVTNGAIVEQTMFNGDFEAGSDRLTPGGLAKIDILTRKRPVAPTVYLQTSRDMAYDPAKAADYVKTKADLDNRRVTAVQQYLSASTSGRGLPPFEIVVTDPGDMTISAVGPANSVRGYSTRFASGIGGLITVNQGAGGATPTANVTGGTTGTAGTGTNAGGTGSGTNSGSGSGAPGAGGTR